MTGKPTYEDLKKRVEELERKIADRKRDNDIHQKYTRDLGFLSRTSTEFVEFPLDESIYQLIGERLKELVGDCVIVINSYNKEKNNLCTRAVEGLGKYSKAVLKLIGRNPVGMSFPITDEEARSQLATGKLVAGPPGLYELSFGEIPAGICRRIEDLLSFGDIYAIGFACKGELFGDAIIITRRGSNGLKGEDIVETFIHQAAVALQRREAEEDLVKARDELEKRVEERTADHANANEQLRLEIEERKRAEEALRESEEKFRSVSEQSPNMIFINKKGKIVYANRICEEIMGYKRDEYYSSDFDFLCLIAPESVDKIHSAFKRHMDGKDVEPYEYTLINKQGKRIEALITTKLMNYEGDRAILGIVTDISERKQVEQALRKSEESYRYLVENANDIIYRTDQTGHFTFFNPIAVKTTEYPPEYLLGRHYLDLIRPDYRKDAEKFYMSQFKERLPSTYYEFPIVTKSGKEIWLGQNVQLIIGGDEVVGIQALARDITSRVQVEKALQESKERYRAIFEQAADSILLVHGETGAMVEFNERAHKSLGYTREEFQNLRISDFEVIESSEEVANHMREIVKKGADSFETKHETKAGEIRDIQVSSRTISIGGENFFQSICRDITELKRAEQVLQKARDELENQVRKRTAELEKINKMLKEEIEERKRVEKVLKRGEEALKLKTQNLKEANVALKVLLESRDKDKAQLEDTVLFNIKGLVLPYLEKLMKTSLDERQITLTDILESNLSEAVSPFLHRLSSKYLGLTPMEIRVANLIKQGKSTKEIAEVFTLSLRTIESHRDSIREKIGIKNKKANLRTHLISMD
jgi:PAS domain S-box-containing protein